MSEELTIDEVSKHSTKKDLYVIIHDQVYNCSTFTDEHPGGEEVLLDVAGQDATEAFEDVGHSDEAREILVGLKVGSLKHTPGESKPKTGSTDKIAAGPGGSSDSSSFSIATYATVVIGGLIAYMAFQYLQNQDKK